MSSSGLAKSAGGLLISWFPISDNLPCLPALFGRAEVKRLEAVLHRAIRAGVGPVDCVPPPAAACPKRGSCSSVTGCCSSVAPSVQAGLPPSLTADGVGFPHDLARLARRLCSHSATGTESEARLLLRCLGLEHHAAALEREEVTTVAELAALQPAGLAAAGLASLGARAAVMDAARGLAVLVEGARGARRR